MRISGKKKSNSSAQLINLIRNERKRGNPIKKAPVSKS